MSIANKDNLTSFPHTIQEICEHAFDGTNCNGKIDLTNAKIRKINDYAFANCANLEAVTISNKITEIGNGAFKNCGKLSSVEIPNNSTSTNITPVSFNLNKIGDSAFEECTQLKNFNLQPSLTYIGDRAFYKSGILNTVTIPTNVEFMGDECFYECGNITELKINSTKLTQISKSAFYNCSKLGSISIPSNIDTIGENAFYNCGNLKSCNDKEKKIFSLPNSIECIEDSAFYNCNLIGSFTLPTNLKRLGNMCFYFYVDVPSGSPISTKTITIPNGLEEPPVFYKRGIENITAKPFRNATILIKVPQDYFTQYAYASNWSKYKSYIKPQD
jgi:hypothetical protein